MTNVILVAKGTEVRSHVVQSVLGNIPDSILFRGKGNLTLAIGSVVLPRSGLAVGNLAMYHILVMNIL